MTFAEATIDIGVFTNDRAAFDAGVATWRRRPRPRSTCRATARSRSRRPPTATPRPRSRRYWHNPTSYITGLQGETLPRPQPHDDGPRRDGQRRRDRRASKASTSSARSSTRIVAGYERNAGYVNEYLDKVAALGGAQPPATWRPTGWVGSTFAVGGVGYRAGWEVAYDHYAARGRLDAEHEAAGGAAAPVGPGLHMSWETLTHAR